MANDLMDTRIDKLLQVSENTLIAFQNFKTEMVERMEQTEQKVDHLDRHATIHSGQAKTLRKAANKRIRSLLPDDTQYKQLRSKYYSWLWTSYQDAFGVTSYMDTRLKHFDAGLDWISDWQPIRSVSMEELRETSMAVGQ